MKKNSIGILLGCCLIFLLISLLGCTMQPQMYSITFDTRGGSAVNSPPVKENEKAMKPPVDPTKAGYTFYNWYSDDTVSTVWDFYTPITKDTTLYAKWTADRHILSFNANEGTGTMADVSLDTDEVKTLSANSFTRDGHIFAGWATTSSGAVVYTDAIHFTMGTSDVTLYAKWRELTIRDIGPGGGYIFYDDEADGSDDIPGYRYLEAAPARWSGISDPMYIFGYHRTADDGEDLLVGTATAIGSGKANTAALVAAMKEETYSNGSGDGDATAKAKYAAKACSDYSGGGYNDWFLPSKDELDLIYDHLRSKNLGSFSRSYVYWSSSESKNTSAWFQKFADGLQSATYRNFNYLVRPVRAF